VRDLAAQASDLGVSAGTLEPNVAFLVEEDPALLDRRPDAQCPANFSAALLGTAQFFG